MHQSRLRVQQRLETRHVVGGRSGVDWVICLGWLDTTSTTACALQQLSYILVIPITSKSKELFAAVGTRIEQYVYRIEVSFAYCEVEGLPVSGQPRIVHEQATKRCRVTINSGTNRVPHITASACPRPIRKVGFKLFKFDHD
jgi:hypothetical protein